MAGVACWMDHLILYNGLSFGSFFAGANIRLASMEYVLRTSAWNLQQHVLIKNETRQPHLRQALRCVSDIEFHAHRLSLLGDGR